MTDQPLSSGMYPILLDLAGRDVLVVGGGIVASPAIAILGEVAK